MFIIAHLGDYKCYLALSLLFNSEIALACYCFSFYCIEQITLMMMTCEQARRRLCATRRYNKSTTNRSNGVWVYSRRFGDGDYTVGHKNMVPLVFLRWLWQM